MKCSSLCRPRCSSTAAAMSSSTAVPSSSSMKSRNSSSIYNSSNHHTHQQRRQFGLMGWNDPKTFNRNPIIDFKLNGCQVYLFSMAHWVDPHSFPFIPVAHEALNDLSGEKRLSLAAFLDLVEPDTVFVDICPARIRSYARWILDNPRPERNPHQMRSAEHPSLLKDKSKLMHKAVTKVEETRSEEEMALDNFEEAFSDTSKSRRLLSSMWSTSTDHQTSEHLTGSSTNQNKNKNNSNNDQLTAPTDFDKGLKSPFKDGKWPKDIVSIDTGMKRSTLPAIPQEDVIKASISRKLDSSFGEKLYRIDKINMIRSLAMSKQRQVLALQDVQFDELDHWMFDQYWASLVDSYSSTIPNIQAFQKEFFMCAPRWRHLSVVYGEEMAMAMFYTLLGSFESYGNNERNQNVVLKSGKELALRTAGMNEKEKSQTLSMDDCLKLDEFLNELEMFSMFDPSSRTPMKNMNIKNTHLNGGFGRTIPTEDLQIITSDHNNNTSSSDDGSGSSNSNSNSNDALYLMRNACNQVMEIRSDQNTKSYLNDSSRRLIMGGMPHNIICDKIREYRKPNWWIHLGMAIRGYYEDRQQVNFQHENPMIWDPFEFGFHPGAREFKFFGWDGMLETMEMLEYVEEEIYDLLIIEQSDYISRCIEAASHTSDTLVAICGAGMADGIVENLTGDKLLDCLERTGMHARYHRTGQKSNTYVLNPF